MFSPVTGRKRTQSHRAIAATAMVVAFGLNARATVAGANLPSPDSGVTQPTPPVLWFCPMDPVLRPEVGYGGSPQYMDLFADGAAWPHALSRVQVFKIYPQWIGRASDADLRRQFAFLNRHHIALALEFGAMSDPEHRYPIEGFGGDGLLAAAQRIAANGGKLRYVAMDEPLYFGSVYRGAHAPGWTAAEVAANVAGNVRRLLAAFPDVEVGDIEPLADNIDAEIDAYAAGVTALQKALGRPLAFFHLDVGWEAVSPVQIKRLRERLQVCRVPFGCIYDGDADAGTSAEWLAGARRHAERVEGESGGPPDQVIFQSWHREPTVLLPESQPDSFTGILNWYALPRPVLTAKMIARELSGRLTNAASPVANATVTVSQSADSPKGGEVPFSASYSGQIPAGTRSVVIAIRANMEGSGIGPVDVKITDLRFSSVATGLVDYPITNSDSLHRWSGLDAHHGVEIVTAPKEAYLHVIARPDQTVLINSPEIATAASGTYQFSVTGQMTAATSGHGYCAVVFLGEHGGIARRLIPFRAVARIIGTAVTDATGKWRLRLPPDVPHASLHAAFAGSADLWPAEIDATQKGSGSQGTGAPGKASDR